MILLDAALDTRTLEAPIDSLPLQKSSEKSIPTTSQLRSVCAITRLLGSETKTVYSFGLEKEIIEIFIDGYLRVRVENSVIQDVYHSDWSNSTLPNDLKLSAATVIDANGCKIKTTRVCDGQKDEIVIFKNDCVLCKASNSTVI
ncbi:uncharacterized protein LOC118180355 [Stegodyphus dumicola]|uniref:uncharacterized protein LOC118180355 n=1 Tax=Stegodyphus dumicola TaxID=202533 RepID=UPI0015A88486|nr:uncharacterized protein LOC118180355 [Stegodyphus dumicola]